MFHPRHDAGAGDFYARTAIDLGYLVTGGSDYHGDPTHGVEPGESSLPEHLWERLREAAAARG